MPAARIEHVTEIVQRIMGRKHTGSHRDEQRRQGWNNSDSEEIQKSTDEDEGSEGWTDALIRDFTRSQGYRNSRRMAVNGMVKQLCREEEVGFVDLWDSFVGKEEMYPRDGSGKMAGVFGEGLSGAVACGLGKLRYLN